MNYLVVLSGVPGSGKSYFSHALKAKKKKHVYIISSDALRKEILGDQKDLSEDTLIFKIYYALIKAYSEDKNGIVILDATHAKKIYRYDSIKPFKPLFDQIDLVCFKLDKETVLKQNKNRDYPIPEDDLIRLIDEYQLPDKEEKVFYHHVDIIVNHDIDKIIKRYL